MGFYIPSNWYWVGSPTGQPPDSLYGSARNGLVSSPSTDADYQSWLAGGNITSPWPTDDTGTQTVAALDTVLLAAGLQPTGLNLAVLQSLVLSKASAYNLALIAQVYSDPAHSTAAPIAALIITVAGGAPSNSSPDYAAFNAYAASYGMSPSNFATLIQAMKTGLLNLASAYGALEVATAAATQASQLTTALATFIASAAAVITAVNAASPLVAITAPPAISINGL